MMNKKINKNNDLMTRFSSSLLGNGRKQSGHKIFLESLFLVRGNEKKKSSFLKSIPQDSKEKSREREERQLNLLKFLLSTGFSVKTLQDCIKRWSDPHKGDSKTVTRYNDYKNIPLPLNTRGSSEIFDRKEASYKEAPLIEKKTSNISSRDLSKISDTTKNKDLQGKESSDLEYLNKTILQLSNKRFLEICKDNVKPVIETRKIRKGRVTYKVPLVTRSERQQGKAIAWLIDNASLRRKKGKEGLPLELIKDTISLSKGVDDRKKNYRSIKSVLALLLSDSFMCKGESVERRKEFHKIALKNRSYTSYRWW